MLDVAADLHGGCIHCSKPRPESPGSEIRSNRRRCFQRTRPAQLSDLECFGIERFQRCFEAGCQNGEERYVCALRISPCARAEHRFGYGGGGALDVKRILHRRA